MITYVNTVFVNNTNAGAVVSAKPTTSDNDKFVIYDVDKNAYVAAPTAENKRIKIGLVTSKTTVMVNHKTGETTAMPVIKWSNIINRDDIKSFNSGAYKAPTNAEDVVKIDFTALKSGNNVFELFQEGGKRLIVRLTFKDLPTRFRKWTESYEYTPKTGDTAETIAEGMAKVINRAYKRARVTASASAGVLTIKALPYDDDNNVDTINVENKVRFSANIYYTNPDAAGFASKNKYFPTGVTVKKTPGEKYKAEAKFVRDREAQAMGYEGILNRGCCTWPIIKPAMVTDLNAHYDYATLEFENMYRTADDLQRRTKQTVEIYSVGGSAGVIAALKTWVAGAAQVKGQNSVNTETQSLD